jgi:hypothetical protein
MNISFEEALRITVEYVTPAHGQFSVGSLFPPLFWNRMPIADRMALGKAFFDYVSKKPELVRVLDKTEEGQQLYEKK